MRRLVLTLAIAGLVALPGQIARADDNGPDPCTAYAARSAMPSLYQSYQFSPQGYGPFGYAPLTYPFGIGPYGVGAFFGGPGVPFGTAPAFGPLGPGLTANNIFTQVINPTGIALGAPANFPTLIGLAALQQGELGTLNTRYSNSAYYQTASATWAGAYATQAASAFTILQALCQNQGASGGSSMSMMPMGGMSMGMGMMPMSSMSSMGTTMMPMGPTMMAPMASGSGQ
jgi:hypothetical protein